MSKVLYHLTGALKARGWTQAKLARIAGMPQQSVSELLRGRKRLIPLTAVKMGTALGLNVELLLIIQAKEGLKRFVGEHPELADEVRARVDRLSQEGE